MVTDRMAETSRLAARRPRIRVLIADDHAIVLQALRSVLLRAGDIEVIGAARDGATAVKEALRLYPDVVLLDYYMPGMDGAEATRRIKEKLPHAKIVMLTGAEDETARMSAVEAGVSGYLTKDTALQQIVDAVRDVHMGKVLIPPTVLAELLQRLMAMRKKTEEARKLASRLTQRELEVIQAIAAGESNKEITERLCISMHTLRNHLRNIMAKLDCRSKTEVLTVALRHGLVDMPQ
jgi:DNA-binding NarL/FixJ family response regulator